MTKKREIAVLVANEKQMAMLITEKMMTEVVEEKVVREEVEEKVTCFDCNVSVLPSEIQVTTNKHQEFFKFGF